MSLLSQFQNELSELGINPGDKVLIALSGGLDSISLAHLSLKTGLILVAAHVNYKLRGPESDADADFVEKICRDWKIPFHLKEAPLETGAGNLQNRARELRYRWFSQLMEEENADFLFTAHHLDDRLETFFINLFRGTGLRGLKSIPVRKYRTVRPLLRFRKKDLAAYADENGLHWRTDSSNLKDVYLRNQIRLNLMPVIEEIDPDASERAGRSLEFLAEADTFFKRMAGQFISDLATDGYVSKIDDEKWEYLFAHPPLHKYVFEELGFSADQLGALEELLNSQPGRFIQGRKLKVYRDRDAFILTSIEAGGKMEAIVQEDQMFINEPLPMQFEWVDPPGDFSKIPWNEVYLDASKVIFPLRVRAWREGDRFKPLGMSGSKKVSDFLIDEKIPLPDKDKTFVILTGDKICWIVGLRIDERFKLGRESSRALKISLKTEPGK